VVPAKLTAPLFIPRKVAVGAGNDAAPEISGGAIGGVPGGVLGGIIGGTSTTAEAMPAAPPTTESKKKEILRIGGDLKPPRVLFAPKPNYPLIARQAHVHGAVIIDAIVDETGNVINARAVDGCPLLIPEALRTVMLWKYEPTYLNGIAYPVALTATVNFALGS
jgi:protein TonB